MKTFELSDEEFEILKDLFLDHGSNCPYTDSDKLQALGEKFGILEPIPELTEEELKRREEFRNSPTGQMLSALISQTNVYFSKIAEDITKDNAFMSGEQWGDKAKVGSQLRIKLPNDYIVGT